eukprot:COSAG02_NODE_31017_length_540_cov_7.748299_1_plen_99_part_10
MEKAEWWQEPPVLRRELLHAGSVAEIRLLERHDKMDKMIKMMEPMSTGQVDPHIAGRFSSISISAKLRTASVSQCRAIRTLAGVITVQALRVRHSESSA